MCRSQSEPQEGKDPFVLGCGEDFTFLGQKYSHCKSALASAESAHVSSVHQFTSSFSHTCARRCVVDEESCWKLQ